MTAPCWQCGLDVPPERDGTPFCCDAHAITWWGAQHEPVEPREVAGSLRTLYGARSAESYEPGFPAPDWSWAP